jgi:hypothetical protein
MQQEEYQYSKTELFLHEVRRKLAYSKKEKALFAIKTGRTSFRSMLGSYRNYNCVKCRITLCSNTNGKKICECGREMTMMLVP